MWTVTNAGESLKSFIRPAIAAANRFALTIPWHQELLERPLASGYVLKFLACLGAQNDNGRFYEELARDTDVLFPQVCNPTQATPVLKYVDGRMVPFLSRYVFSGTDQFFEGLCTLALRVSLPEIDNVLASLFYRWTQRFDIRSTVPQHDQNYELRRGFKRLSEHPRFGMIEGWQSRLALLLHVPLSWYWRQDIVRVLERDPRSYVHIESLLFKAENWEHFYRDEIDWLDESAERLFQQLLEE
jgi:hypothetical protein